MQASPRYRRIDNAADWGQRAALTFDHPLSKT